MFLLERFYYMTNHEYYIDVILPIPVVQLFTYKVNLEEAKFLRQGFRVAVPFGKSKITTALVYSVHQNAPTVYEAKEIYQILDESPVVSEKQLAHWEWIASYYMCSLGEVMKAAMPNVLLISSETIIFKTHDKTFDDDFKISDESYLILEALEHHSELSVSDISKITQRKQSFKYLKQLIDANLISTKEELYEQYKPKQIRYVKLSEAFNNDLALKELLDNLKRAKKQHEVLLNYFMLRNNMEHIKVKDLKEKSGASSTIIKTLIEKGIFDEYYLTSDRFQYSGEDHELKVLSDAQEAAFQNIKQLFERKDITLLYGVTSSGKTEVYVKLIQEYLERGQQVLYLLPEIALTTQLITRLQYYFGKAVAVFHSKYSSNERVEVWNKVLVNSKKAKVIIGARSAVLLPFTNLGLIIIDEEHESSYKQFDPAPRYHARDAAVVLGKLHKAKILLGSATPSLESFYNASKDKYGLVTLKERYGNVLMPDIQLIDIKDKHKRKKMTGHFSDLLIKEIEEALSENEQIILFQNRRGFSPIIECNTCGNATQCPNCDVSLTYHQYKNQLRCHYCGYHMAMQRSCLACGSPELDTKGFGTEQIEAEVNQLFPTARASRMDLDTTRGKYGYEKIIHAFESHEIDILIGTQMVTKGLDFRNVSLVGVLNADNMLNFPDFRSHERCYQLLQQVAGRSGRTKKRGKVLIQTYNPYHTILQQVSSNAYEAMYHEQIDQRHIYKYPPINRIIKITFKGKDYNLVNEASIWFYKALHTAFTVNVLGPEFPPVARIRNQYLKHILLKIPSEQSIKKTKDYISNVQKSFAAIPKFRSIRTIINVDNY